MDWRLLLLLPAAAYGIALSTAGRLPLSAGRGRRIVASAAGSSPAGAISRQKPVSAGRGRRILASAAGSSPAGAISGFWREVVEAQQAGSVREATLLLAKGADGKLLLEYMNSCCELVGVIGGSTIATSAAAANGATAITVWIEPAAAPEAALPEASAARAEFPSREAALESMMGWFTAQLLACEIGDLDAGEDEAETDDANFVALGRSLLHTKASLVSSAPTVSEMHRDFWTMVADADFLQDGSGGAALFVAPSFTNYDLFDDFSLLVRSGLRYLVSPKIVVNVYHPLAMAERLRAPQPTVHVYLDNDSLFAEGNGSLASLLQGM